MYKSINGFYPIENIQNIQNIQSLSSFLKKSDAFDDFDNKIVIESVEKPWLRPIHRLLRFMIEFSTEMGSTPKIVYSFFRYVQNVFRVTLGIDIDQTDVDGFTVLELFVMYVLTVLSSLCKKSIRNELSNTLQTILDFYPDEKKTIELLYKVNKLYHIDSFDFYRKIMIYHLLNRKRKGLLIII